ncbi:hypothetical protein FQR65_LT15781 [Abscondita terminalis]|nr:hypothetical protein FQR65_LT15781 [Abscondita terminalis]
MKAAKTTKISEAAPDRNIPFYHWRESNEIASGNPGLNSGADKISINFSSSASVRSSSMRCRPLSELICVVAVRYPDILKTEDWIREAQDRGAGEILLTSMDHDGTKNGFDCSFLKKINAMIGIPLIASGGAGNQKHFTEVFQQTGVDAALAASVFHYGEILIPE